MTPLSSPDITSIRWRIADVQPADAQRWLGTLRHPRPVRILEARPQVREELARAMNYRAVIRPSVAAALLHLGGRVDRSLTQAFLDDLANEAPSDPTHPAGAFRNAVARMPARARHVGRTTIMNMAIQAWNAARAGETLPHLASQPETQATRLIAVVGLGHDDGLDLIGTNSLAQTANADGDEALNVSVEIVTAEVAGRLLASNPRNRPVDRSTGQPWNATKGT